MDTVLRLDFECVKPCAGSYDIQGLLADKDRTMKPELALDHSLVSKKGHSTQTTLSVSKFTSGL
jgi:hypothetical protein